MHSIRLIAHDVRSCHNVGALLRTADGIGVEKVYLSGFTPYPKIAHDSRLPHIAEKLTKQIHKTALGAENTIDWQATDNIFELIEKLKHDNYRLIGLEQSKNAISLPNYKPSDKTALLIGRELEGIDQSLLELCDEIVEIPMFGKKESFNVVQATAMALYHLQFYNT